MSKNIILKTTLIVFFVVLGACDSGSKSTSNSCSINDCIKYMINNKYILDGGESIEHLSEYTLEKNGAIGGFNVDLCIPEYRGGELWDYNCEEVTILKFKNVDYAKIFIKEYPRSIAKGRWGMQYSRHGGTIKEWSDILINFCNTCYDGKGELLIH